METEPQTVAEPIPVVVDALSELQLTISMHQAKKAAMAAELDNLESSLSRIATLSTGLKVRISEGDNSAAQQLDQLEGEAITIQRSAEGLRLRLSRLDADIAPLIEEANRLAAQRDRERQDATVRSAYVRKDQMIRDLLSYWEKANSAAFDLMELVAGVTEIDQRREVHLEGQRQVLDEEHRRQLAGLVTEIGERLMRARALHVNQAAYYDFHYSQVFRHLEVVPARRREEPRRAG